MPGLHRSRRSLPKYALLVVLLSVLGVLLLYPIVLTVQGAFYKDPVAGGAGSAGKEGGASGASTSAMPADRAHIK